MEKENVIITSALPYSNGDLHLGHLASTYLPADIFARFMRMAGKNVVFACGGDDYGTPILIKAEKEGISPEEYVERWHKRQKEDFKRVGISFDIYYQTHSPENRELAQHFFKKIYEKGYIYKKEIEQFYCPNCKRFLPDRYIIGTCPYCGAENQYGDGCEVCGRTYEPTQLINPRCAVCGSKPVIKKTTHYFFKLSAFSERLKEWLESNKNLQEDVKNYVLRWIEEGLKDWDITRDIEWGVPIPLEEAKGKVLYGWFENHLGYISFVLKYCKDHGIDGIKFWNSSTIYHFIGKDIVYHHYLFMPAERMAEGTFKLPDFLPTRGHLLLEGKKFSKSRGWYISIKDFVNVFPADYLRYYIASIVPFSQKDVNFSLKTFQEKINNELVAAVGNFIHRVLKFLWEKFDGIVPNPRNFDEEDKIFENKIRETPQKVFSLVRKNELDRALKEILSLAFDANSYFQKKEPWKTKDKACLYLSINAVRNLLALLYPYIPFKAKEAWHFLNLPYSIEDERLDRLNELIIRPGHKIKEPKIVFEKVSEKDLERLRKVFNPEGSNTIDMGKEISFKDFQRIELKVGKVIDVQEIPGAKTLYKLIVSFGDEKRQVISGLKKYYKPEELKGRKFIFVTNLEKKKFMGEESQAMILAAEDEEGNLALLIPDKDIKEGAKVY